MISGQDGTEYIALLYRFGSNLAKKTIFSFILTREFGTPSFSTTDFIQGSSDIQFEIDWLQLLVDCSINSLSSTSFTFNDGILLTFIM